MWLNNVPRQRQDFNLDLPFFLVGTFLHLLYMRTYTHVPHAQQGWVLESSCWHSEGTPRGEAENLEALFHLPSTQFGFQLGPDSGPEGETHTLLSSLAWELDFLVDVTLLSALAVQGRARALPNVASTSVRTDSGG